MDWDVFNGDADGLCALHQLRLAEPRTSTLVTGVKRDVGLLSRVTAQFGDRVTVLDISVGANQVALERLLDNDANVIWFDHHHGVPPTHARLTAYIETHPDRCTSLIVNDYLQRRFEPWALVAAYGDNLVTVAQTLAIAMGLGENERNALNELGVLINYNAYGEAIDELLIAPDALYERLKPHASPFAFISAEPALLRALRDRFHSDLAEAEAHAKRVEAPGFTLTYLPDTPWAKRVSGVFANQLARRAPEQAHAVFLERSDGSFKVGLRGPLNNPRDADNVCLRFPNGGGRCGAAGVPRLPAALETAFVEALREVYP